MTTRERNADWPAFGLIGLGIVVRVAQYTFNRSLWLDEAKLAINIVSRSMIGLMAPLAEQQGAPFGFLFIQKAATLAFGTGEYALRLFPLVAGLISLWLFDRVARRILPRQTALFALAIFALLDPLIYFSSEVKQYSSDVMVALALLLVGLEVQARGTTTRALAWAAAAGAVAVWFSHPAAFVLAGMGSTWALTLALRGEWRGVVRVAATCLIWLASFTLFYFVSLDQLIADPFLQTFWSTRFLEMPNSPSQWAWWGPTILFAIAGLASLRSSPSVLGLLVLPAAIGFVAGLLQLYPFSGRLLLFLLPSWLIVGAASAGSAADWANRKIQHTGTAFLLILALASSLPAAYHLVVPREKEELRDGLLWMASRFEPGDAVYVYSGARAQYMYYRHRYSLPDQFTLGVFSRTDRSRYIADLDQFRGQSRVWVLFSHVYRHSPLPLDEQEFYINHLDQIGRRLGEHTDTGAAVYLYDLSTPPTRLASVR